MNDDEARAFYAAEEKLRAATAQLFKLDPRRAILLLLEMATRCVKGR